MNIELNKGFTKALRGKVSRWNFNVGVLDDKPHFQPLVRRPRPATKNYAGGPARKQSRKVSDLTIGEVLVENMERTGKNFLLAPFKKKNSDLIKFMHSFLKMALANKSNRRVENLLQAVVRNPIFKQEYGTNSNLTKKIKGFDRHLIDTSQMFQAIKAKVKRV